MDNVKRTQGIGAKQLISEATQKKQASVCWAG